MTQIKFIFLLLAFVCTNAIYVPALAAVKTAWIATPKADPKNGEEAKRGTMVTEKLASHILRGNCIGLDPNRNIKVYLPPGYANSGKSYPVVYYLHSLFVSPEKLLEDGNLVKLLDRGFASGMVKEFIFVLADYSTGTTGSLYENSPSTARWLDFTADELVPFIDSRFRTLCHSDSRALAGDYMGGRGAFQLAMLHPELFSTVYALNPVGTAVGLLPLPALADWQKIHRAKSFADLEGDPISQIFVAMGQAFMPNPGRPPFYCDFLMEMKDGKPVLDEENARKLKSGFLLDHLLEKHAGNLRKMRGIAFDWARYDPIQDHVYASQALTRKLESFGIEHEAEEYRGVPWKENWSENGRFYTRLLPFMARHLVFEVQN